MLLVQFLLLLNVYFILQDIYWTLLIPVIAVILYMYFYSLDKILLLTAFFTPIAINMYLPQFGWGLSLPTEPLMAGVMALFIIKIFYSDNYDRKILKHPLTIAILLSLAWMFITSLTSQIPLVSFKALTCKAMVCHSFLLCRDSAVQENKEYPLIYLALCYPSRRCDYLYDLQSLFMGIFREVRTLGDGTFL